LGKPLQTDIPNTLRKIWCLNEDRTKLINVQLIFAARRTSPELIPATENDPMRRPVAFWYTDNDGSRVDGGQLNRSHSQPWDPWTNPGPCYLLKVKHFFVCVYTEADARQRRRHSLLLVNSYYNVPTGSVGKGGDVSQEFSLAAVSPAIGLSLVVDVTLFAHARVDEQLKIPLSDGVDIAISKRHLDPQSKIALST
jgi:hypothetical protein